MGCGSGLKAFKNSMLLANDCSNVKRLYNFSLICKACISAYHLNHGNIGTSKCQACVPERPRTLVSWIRARSN